MERYGRLLARYRVCACMQNTQKLDLDQMLKLFRTKLILIAIAVFTGGRGNRGN